MQKISLTASNSHFKSNHFLKFNYGTDINGTPKYSELKKKEVILLFFQSK